MSGKGMSKKPPKLPSTPIVGGIGVTKGSLPHKGKRRKGGG